MWPIIIEWLSRLVFFLLICLSIWSLSIIIDRKRFFSRLTIKQLAGLKISIEEGKSLQQIISNESLEGRFAKVLYNTKSTENLEYSFNAFISEENKDLEKGIPILGTMGATTPFVGLLGTILGIIVSFAKLSQGGGGTNEVMFSLAEALILTAVGLLVAIPSVVAFNYFNKKIRTILVELKIIKDLYIAKKG